MAKLMKRWRGGAAADRGFSAVGAKIQLAKKQKAEPKLDWCIAPHPYLADRFELQAFEKQVSAPSDN